MKETRWRSRLQNKSFLVSSDLEEIKESEVYVLGGVVDHVIRKVLAHVLWLWIFSGSSK